jgi:4-amino-4-deoxy-L-arabinose transferase-like glycosyltransferase
MATLVVRAYLSLNTPVIAKDATYYIGQAQLITQGAWRQAFLYDFEPLFPFVISLFHSLVLDWELAGKLTSLTFGVLGAIPLFLISQHVFGIRTAFAAGILYAVHPFFAHNSADALTESTYIFFFLFSIWLVLVTLKDCRMQAYLLCAVSILLARLTRTEGIWLFPVGLLFYGVRSLTASRQRKGQEARHLVRFALAFLAVMLPVIVYGAWIGGRSEFAAYKGLGWLADVLGKVVAAAQRGFGDGAQLDSLRDFGPLVWQYYVYQFVETFHPVLLLLASYALLQRTVRRQYRDYFLLAGSVWIIYLGGIFLAGVIRGVEETSRRFMMAPVAVALPWAGLAIDGAAARLQKSRLFSRLWTVVGIRLSGTSPGLETIILVAISVVLAVQTVQAQRVDKLPIKEAGTWIAAQEWKEPLILTDDGRIAFYARGRMVPISGTLAGETVQQQVQVVKKLVKEARSLNAGFIFLKGRLRMEAQTAILVSGAVEQTREWQSPYGNAYTLICLKTGGE